MQQEPTVKVTLDIQVRGKVVREVPLREALEWMAVAYEEQGSVKLAADENRTVLPHVFLPLHSHLAAANPSSMLIEYTTNPAIDPYAQFLKKPLNINDGKLTMSDEPGNGWQLDWDLAVSLSAKSVTL